MTKHVDGEERAAVDDTTASKPMGIIDSGPDPLGVPSLDDRLDFLDDRMGALEAAFLAVVRHLAAPGGRAPGSPPLSDSMVRAVEERIGGGKS